MKKIKKETVISLVILSQLFLQNFNLSINYFLDINNTQVFTYSYYGVILFLVYIGILNQKVTNKYGIFILLIFILVGLTSYGLFPETRMFYLSQDMIIIYILVLPLLLYTIDFNINIDIVINKISRISKWLLPWSILGLFYLDFDNKINYMVYSYALLPSIMSFLYTFSKNIKLIDILYFFMGLILVILYGSRTVFIVIIAYLLISVLFSFKLNRNINFNKLIVVLLLYTAIFTIFLFLIGQFREYNTRIVNFLMNGDIFEDQNRVTLYNLLLQHMKQHVFIGNGIFSDRIIIYNITGEFAYSHNFFIEIYVSFGLVGFILVTFIAIYWLAKFLTLNTILKYQFIYLALTFFSRYLVSGSYIEEVNFYLFVCLSYIVLKNYKNTRGKLHEKDYIHN
ncbi:MAG TPA: O-antigen ligase family protein [Acholeplasmataceae bacterium]|nr:O-antigen ligase family protein [Acholeplasmataceae bacterium]